MQPKVREFYKLERLWSINFDQMPQEEGLQATE
jgi:ribosomal silencing factor RsfS